MGRKDFGLLRWIGWGARGRRSLGGNGKVKCWKAAEYRPVPRPEVVDGLPTAYCLLRRRRRRAWLPWPVRSSCAARVNRIFVHGGRRHGGKEVRKWGTASFDSSSGGRRAETFPTPPQHHQPGQGPGQGLGPGPGPAVNGCLVSLFRSLSLSLRSHVAHSSLGRSIAHSSLSRFQRTCSTPLPLPLPLPPKSPATPPPTTHHLPPCHQPSDMGKSTG